MKNSLEILAAIPPKKFLHNVRVANERIAELERQLAAQSQIAQLAAAQTKPVESAPVTPATSAPVVPAIPKTGREKFIAGCKVENLKASPYDATAKGKGHERFAASVRIEGQGPK